MIDHIGFAVSDIGRAKSFFEAALAPLGIGIVMEVTAEQTGADAHIGFGANGKAFFWIGDGKMTVRNVHVAFTAQSRGAVDAFYNAAMKAGGADNGAPDVRAYYHPDYYAAFVTDPDGNNIEAVCHLPE